MDDQDKANTSKPDDQTVKLREEIKSLRQQRFLAILGVAGAVMAFLFTNANRISDLIHHQPKILVTTADEFLRRNAQLTITSRGQNESVVVSDSLPASPKAYSLNPGVYHLAIEAFGEKIYELDFTIERDEDKTFIVPNLGANTRLTVDNRSGRIGPGSQLEFQVESSGNGYLWVFEKSTRGYALIYPENCPTDCGNAVSVSRSLHIPDQNKRAIFAGSKAGKETLLFLLTSSAENDSAKRLASQFANAAIPKASGGYAKDNWGYAEVTYIILE